jgi:hypothetical protein
MVIEETWANHTNIDHSIFTLESNRIYRIKYKHFWEADTLIMYVQSSPQDRQYNDYIIQKYDICIIL